MIRLQDTDWGYLLKKYNVNLRDLKDKYDLVVFRCHYCADELRTEYNPYVYDNGSQIPVDRIKIIEVKDHDDDCENKEDNMYLGRAIPIELYNNVDDIIYAAFPELAK